ncbi:Acetyltransferase (GNAT) family protein [Thermoleophilum album]|uniref:Acetyltransferase (GNAT) family protein n=1 Tax=Thermoleophilum album TaxID=29539 RepID=A0A1H6FXB3_THEAL|nr:Acetyltransferase (GNAT) family protein [Thermoleophilum album]
MTLADGEGVAVRRGRITELRRAHEFARAAAKAWRDQCDVASASLAARTRPWEQEAGLQEFLAAQPGASFWLCERAGELVGVLRTTRFEGMEEALELTVAREYAGRGIARRLLEAAWPGTPTPELGRLAVVPGAARDLGLFMSFGVMPVAGSWQLRLPAAAYRERRASERVDEQRVPVHVLELATALEAWRELEPPALGYARPWLHEWFGRSRVCLGLLGHGSTPRAVCWVSADGDIGPAVAWSAEELVPVVLAALDRVASTCDREALEVRCSTASWWLLRRLHVLGFRVAATNWVLSSVPLPATDRYLPVQPPVLL